MILVYPAATCLLFYISLLLYYRQAWINIPFFEPGELAPSVYITVIIPARNEAENITDCILSLQQQTYPTHLFEILVVDDFSDDGTPAIVRSLNVANLQLVILKDLLGDRSFNSYKKKSIEIAVAKAKGSLIVTTDADCTAPADWLQTIASFYQKNNSAFIAAPVCFKNESSFLDRFQSLDFMSLQGITGAAVSKKQMNMCNGANMAYEKKCFEEVNGFSNIDNIASGDDMLLMQKIASLHPGRVHYLKSMSAIVQTKTSGSWKNFINQRIRWASKATYYKDKRIFLVLLIILLLNLSILLLGIQAFHSSLLFYSFISIFSLKTIFEFIFLFPVTGFFSKQKLLWWFPLAQPLHILYTVIAGLLGQFGSYEWKGRKVK